MPTDSRYFEVALIQQMIIDAVAMQMAQAYLKAGEMPTEKFVAGRLLDVRALPKDDLAAALETLRNAQTDLLRTDKQVYQPGEVVRFLQRELDYKSPEVKQSLSQVPIETMALVKVDEASGESDKTGVWPTNRSDAEWDELFQQTAFFDEYPWVVSLFAKELVYREFFRESKV